MTFVWTASVLAVAALVLAAQLGRALGRVRGAMIALVLAAGLEGAWWWLTQADPVEAAPADWSLVESVSSETCARCHAGHYESWHRTYHRTMTRDAAPDTVKGDFDHAEYHYLGTTTQFTREGDAFFINTVDRDWSAAHARAPERDIGPTRYRKLRVDRTVGSHWVQEYMHRETNGRFSRMPVMYHIVEKRWIHSHGGFLAPETSGFWDKSSAAWNDTCLYCHNTGPAKNPQFFGGQFVGYKTTVAELGISCETCHGPGGEHVRRNQNPARRLALQESTAGDPSIVLPPRLSIARRDQVCARCHGAIVPQVQTWDPRSHRDPFIAGQDLLHFNTYFWSESQQRQLAGRPVQGAEPVDGRFWGDGTPLTTALEYNGMALSACYQNGQGSMSCLSCHTLHGPEPNFLLKPGLKDSNDACLQCHEDYRSRLTEHTRHQAQSSGSLCYSCHMPHQVFSLLTTHRSHRIQIPEVTNAKDSGKPNACNLCHLDKSLGWTQQELARWPNHGRQRPATLSREQEQVSAALLLLAEGDARSRAIVAGAFSNPAAQRASGTDWFAPFLTRLMEMERYPIVRYLAHRGLRTALGESAAGPFDYLAGPAERSEQLRQLRQRLDVPISRDLPYLPLTPRRLPDEGALKRLLDKRHDPNVGINE
jgi:predicted CXXCH cytochrome family protein